VVSVAVRMIAVLVLITQLLLGDDISGPLKHSFIHTGHADATGKLWGDPGQIDEWVSFWCFSFLPF